MSGEGGDGNQRDACNRCGQSDGHGWVEGDCVLPHRRHSTRLVDGTHVCIPCVDRHKAWAREIGDLYAGLGDVILAGSVPVDEAEYQKPRKAPASPSPLRLDAWAMFTGKVNASVRGDDGEMHDAYMGANLPDVPVILAGWAQAAYDANDWTATAPTDVSGTVTVLIAQADIIAGIEDVDTYDAELRWVYRALRRAHGLSTTGRKPVGRCPSLDGHGKECDGPLWPNPNGVMSVDCGRCARHYGEGFLRHLGGMIA